VVSANPQLLVQNGGCVDLRLTLFFNHLGEKSKKPKQEPPESKLPPAVQELIRLICDVDIMEQTMIEMQYDTKKLPLGKITPNQIKAGYEALKRIADLIGGGGSNDTGGTATPPAKSGKRGSKSSGGGGGSHAALLQACNDFYTRIPHEFGMRVRAKCHIIQV
jgi:poly [ADP-ribose] polymerase